MAFPDFVANATVSRGTIASHMATKMKSSADEVLQLVKSIPNLEFSLPMHYSKWDGQGRLLVTFAPLRDESEVTELIAFDASGKKVILSAVEVPDDPTLVLAIDEDVEYRNVDVVSLAKVADCGEGFHLEITSFILSNDHEPWYKGDPEIYVKVQRNGSGSWRRTDLPEVNEEEHWYYMGRTIYDWATPVDFPDSWVYIEVWEDDSWPDSDDRIVWKRHWTYANPSYDDMQYFYFIGSGLGQYKYKTNEAGLQVETYYLS